jgi:hypothetical protein
VTAIQNVLVFFVVFFPELEKDAVIIHPSYPRDLHDLGHPGSEARGDDGVHVYASTTYIDLLNKLGEDSLGFFVGLLCESSLNEVNEGTESVMVREPTN